MSLSDSDSVFESDSVLENENFSEDENESDDNYIYGGLDAKRNDGLDPLDTLDNALF